MNGAINGWILTLVSVAVVFAALIILYFLYTLIGKICTRTLTAPIDVKQDNDSDEERAAAIAVAMALSEGAQTPFPNQETGLWGAPGSNFRKTVKL